MIPEPGSPEAWLRFAKSDLAIAKTARQEEILLEELCFHAQQACEKSIKAVLISKGIEPPKTHHIGALLEVVSLSEKVPQKILESSKLSDYAVSFRYPGIYEDIDTEELEEAIFLAEAVLDWAQKLVESGLLRD